MQVTFYENVSKRINSTFRPTGGVEKNVRLKEPTDMLNPVFILQDMNIQFTHAYAFGMYYQVTNRVFVTNDIQEVHCRVDALATVKDYIASYNCFVERANIQTPYLDDNLVSVTGDFVDRSLTALDLFGLEFPQTQPKYFDRNGCFLIRVVAPPPATTQSLGVSTGIVTYTIERGELYKLLNYAFDENNFSQIMADVAIKAVFNPIDYLIDIKWLPISPTDLANTDTPEYVPLGWWVTNAQGYVVSTRRPPTYVVPDPVYEIVFTKTPRAYYNDYRLTSQRFTRLYMYIPGVGTVDVDSSNLTGELNLKYTIDRCTGDAFAELYTHLTGGGSYMIGRYPAQLSCKINLAQASVDMQGVVSNIISGSQNAYIGNYVSSASALVDVVTNITNPSTRIIGENGSMGNLSDALEDGWRIFVDSYGSCDQPITCGKPLYKNRTLGTLSGFIKCGNASISTPFMEPVNEQVNELLNSGFYFE